MRNQYTAQNWTSLSPSGIVLLALDDLWQTVTEAVHNSEDLAVRFKDDDRLLDVQNTKRWLDTEGRLILDQIQSKVHLGNLNWYEDMLDALRAGKRMFLRGCEFDSDDEIDVVCKWAQKVLKYLQRGFETYSSEDATNALEVCEINGEGFLSWENRSCVGFHQSSSERHVRDYLANQDEPAAA